MVFQEGRRTKRAHRLTSLRTLHKDETRKKLPKFMYCSLIHMSKKPEPEAHPPSFADSNRLGYLYAESGQTLQGSFSAVSKPNVASKYSLESSRRDLAKFIKISLELVDFRADFYRNFTKSCRINKNYHQVR